MNNDFPLLSLTKPKVAKRRPQKPRFAPPSPEIINNRQKIARELQQQVQPLSNELQEMTPEERESVFLKIEHEKPISLSGTDLKIVSDYNQISNFTLAIPQQDNLQKLEAKVKEFGEGELNKNMPPHPELGYIEKIEKGKPEDRLCQDFFENYDEIIEKEWIICEIEIISLKRGKNQRRKELQEIRTALEQLFANGVYGNIFEHEEIKGTCRAVIRCSGKIFKCLVEDKQWQTKIFWFDTRPQFETLSQTYRNFNIANLGKLIPPKKDAPIVCIIDSGVTAGNPFLKPVVKEDLLKSFLSSASDPYDQYGHGSGVASLASYYALNIAEEAENEGKVWIASARVLDKNNEIEDERLFSKVLIEIVDTFVPLGVRIFNLSIGIINRKWNAEAKRTVPRRSWIARTIDRLSKEKDIVFVISTGNIHCRKVQDYWQNGQTYPDYFADGEATILDPAQAALALTVGSIAPSTLVSGNRTGSTMAIALENQPSPFTRCGPGIKGEIKPELVEFGGNYIIEENGSVRRNLGTNVMMASNQITPAIAHNCGTSFAAPRISHVMAKILSNLQNLDDHISAPLLKAFTVNSASYSGLEEDFQLFPQKTDKEQSNRYNLVGYGMPDFDRATDCDPYTTILFFQGKIQPNHVVYFNIPVPGCLAAAQQGVKRLTVTVVYDPPVQRWGLEEYFGITLKWHMFRGDIKQEDIINAMSQEEEDSLDNSPVEVPNKLNFSPGVNLRSKGTVQHGVWEWHKHSEKYSEHFYTLAIATYQKWSSKTLKPVPYAVVVRLEDTTRTAPIYTEIQNLLQTPIRVKTRT